MKKVKTDTKSRVLVNTMCKLHTGQVSKFYCSHLDCRIHLCQICLKNHPKEHLPTLNTIENVKEKALTSIESQIEQKFKKNLQTIIRSDQMNRMFKETFFTLIQQNTTMNLDEEDVADIVADTLARNYFSKEVSIHQITEKNHTLPLEKRDLLSFDSKSDGEDNYDSDDDSGPEDKENEGTRKWYEESQKYQKKFSDKSSKFYGRNTLEVLYQESKNHAILWNAQYQKLYYFGDERKYTIPEPFNSLAILGSVFFAAADKKLVLYYMKKDENLKDNQPLKVIKEIPHNEIVFLRSDSKRLLFVVLVTLEASIYRVTKNFELREHASFRLSDIPKDVLIDSVNGLLFIQYEGNVLEIYRNLYQTPRLIKRFRDEDFSWHRSSRKLLLFSSGKLYQLNKGKFKLLKVVDKSIECKDLTKFGIIGTSRDDIFLYLISQKNSTKKTILTLPSVEDQIYLLQRERYDRVSGLVDPDAEEEIGDLEIDLKKIKLVAEDPTHLLIYLNMSSYQSARQLEERSDDHWREFGGTVYTQWLLKYNLKNEKYQVSYT